MHVEIWSDIACPWCSLGKRHFDTALHPQGAREVPLTERYAEAVTRGV